VREWVIRGNTVVAIFQWISRNQLMEAVWNVAAELLPVPKVRNPSCIFVLCEWPTFFGEALTGSITVRVTILVGYMEVRVATGL
jgi:hypothetical protein